MPVIITGAITVVFFIVSSTENTSKETNSYIRITNCILSIPATTRTQEDIARCYDFVESEQGGDLVRFDHLF